MILEQRVVLAQLAESFKEALFGGQHAEQMADPRTRLALDQPAEVAGHIGRDAGIRRWHQRIAAAPTGAQHVDTDIPGNAVEPGPEVVPNLAQREHPAEDFLDGVLGIVRSAELSPAEPQHRLAEELFQQHSGPVIARAQARHQ